MFLENIYEDDKNVTPIEPLCAVTECWMNLGCAVDISIG